jgi:uncharacterized membrane protein
MTAFVLPSSRQQWRRLALGASLALNVLLLAYVATQLLQPPPQRPAPRAVGIQAMIERISRDLPPGDKQIFEEAFARDRPRLMAASEQMRAARRSLDATIAARPFDPAATRAAIEQWRDAWQRMSAMFNESFLAALQEISPDGRATIAAPAPSDPARRPQRAPAQGETR